jgi:signal transduction histidine kinase
LPGPQDGDRRSTDGGVAHDFNNILTVISGTIEILAEAVADREDLAAIAGLITEAATRGANLTSRAFADIGMVRDFIKQSNGHINVRNDAGRGTSVKMYLPRASGFVQPLAEDSGEAGDEAILIVEDDDLVRRYVVTQV